MNAIPDPTLRKLILAGVVFDTRFLAEYADHFIEGLFASVEERWIVDTALAFYRDYRAAPGPDVFAVELGKVVDQPDLIAGVDALYRTVDAARRETERATYEYAYQHAGEWLRREAFLRAMDDAPLDVQAGRLEKAMARFTAAFAIGTRIEGKEYKLFGDAEAWTREIPQRPGAVVDTGLPVLDAAIRGGLRAGELGVWMGPPNRGKSHALVWCAVRAARAGKHVLYVSLEMDDESLLGRATANITGIDPLELWREQQLTRKLLREARARDFAAGGEVTVRVFPTKGIGVSIISRLLDQYAAQHTPVDVLVLDYADILDHGAARRQDKAYVAIGETYEALRGVCGRYEIPCWTATQTNRKALGKTTEGALIEMDDVADSWEKAKIADVIISLNQTDAQRNRGEMSLYLAKVRNGTARGEAVRVRVDWRHSRIEDLGRDPDAAPVLSAEALTFLHTTDADIDAVVNGTTPEGVV